LLDGGQICVEKSPQALKCGRVSFQPNDFFTGQPVKECVTQTHLAIWLTRAQRIDLYPLEYLAHGD